ncbi:MAG: hypothetical protein AAGG68_13485 [Bacteroidota bacterium]
MKNYPIVILVLLFWSVANTSLATAYSSFDVTKIGSTFVSVQQVEQELLDHVWFKESSKLLFGEAGVVTIINDTDIESSIWQLEQQNQSIYLKMATSVCGELVYRLEREGTTLRWIDEKTNLKIKVDSTALEENDKVVEVHRNLIGTWSSSIYPSAVIDDLSDEEGRSIMSADFKYLLRADGTFSKVISINRKKTSSLNGLWQLSENGEELILHLRKKDCTYETIVADIKLLTMDELVLGQALATSDLEKQLCKEKKTFFYNKQ